MDAVGVRGPVDVGHGRFGRLDAGGRSKTFF
jgi:hypothetical protein